LLKIDLKTYRQYNIIALSSYKKSKKHEGFIMQIAL
jgi:hypothetical protein